MLRNFYLFIKKRSTLVIIAAVVVTSGASTVAVWAAIPSAAGTIDACYNKNTRELKVVDTEAGKDCKRSEKAISWPSEQAQGPQTAYVFLNADKTLNSEYSKNVSHVTVSKEGDFYVFCFDLSFEPKWSDANFTTGKASVRGAVGHANTIDSRCGAEYEASYFGSVGEPFERVSFAFFD